METDQFSKNNTFSSTSADFENTINITADRTSIAGNYSDLLTFNISTKSYPIYFDLNGRLDGIDKGNIKGYGTCDVYIEDELVATDVYDFWLAYPYGTKYEVKNIKATDGHHFSGTSPDTTLTGMIGEHCGFNTNLGGYYTTGTTLAFETNKLQINYHGDGATSWMGSTNNDAKELDVSGKDIVATETVAYDTEYSTQEENRHFCSASRLKREGYVAKLHTWALKDGTELSDQEVLEYAQDIAKYCGVLDDFLTDDVTIDLYPVWIKETSQLNLNTNGGSFADGSSFKVSADLLHYAGTANNNVSSYTPTREGYIFDGWYTASEGGTQVYDANGNAVEGTNYWQNGMYVNTEGSNILLGDVGQDYNASVYYKSGDTSSRIIRSDWIEDDSLDFGKYKSTTIPDLSSIPGSYKGVFNAVVKGYIARTDLDYIDLYGKQTTLTFKAKSEVPMVFNYWGIEGTGDVLCSGDDMLKLSDSWKSYKKVSIFQTNFDKTGPYSLCFYTSISTGTFSIADISIQLDTDVELFAHWTKI